MNPKQTSYVPALRFRPLTSFYDVALHYTLREDTFKGRLVKQANIREGHRVLDLGVGTGTTALRLLDEFDGVRIVGLDVSSEMLARARKRLRRHRGRFELRRGDLAAPELDGAYDAIVSVLAIHHLWADEKRHLLARLWEHITPGGILIVADAFRHASDLLAEVYDYERPEDPHEAEHDHPDTAAEHLQWMVAAGFASVDVVWKYEDVGVLVAWKADRRPRS
jgi:tRNA (cmo5U34)-methyltransferase